MFRLNALYLRHMVIKKFISILCLLCMTLQVLPLAQIGRALSSNQWTEELPHNADEIGKSASVKFSSTLPPETFLMMAGLAQSSAMLRVQISSTIPSNHSTDVVSPPPDAA